MMKLLNLLVIGSYSRNAGKTTFTQRVIKTMNGKVTALKVTVIKDDRLICPRGGSGCGVCTSLQSDFEITEEIDPCTGKDTSKLLEAGAEKVYWLRVKESAVLKGMEELMKKFNPDKPIVCESNSLMKYINPSLFFILKAKNEDSKKKSALSVEEKADLIIETTVDSSNFDFSKLTFNNSRWELKS